MKKFFVYPITYIVYIAIFFSTGIAIAFLIKNFKFIYISLIIEFILLFISITLVFKNYYYISLFMIILSFLFIGYSYTMIRYYNIFKNTLDNFDKEIKAYNAKILHYEGVIGFRDRYIAYIDKVYDGSNWYNYAGNIRIYYNSIKPIFINDEITVSTKLNLYKNILTNDNSSKFIIKILSDRMLYGVSSIYRYDNLVVQKDGFSIINYINNYALKIRRIFKESLGSNIKSIEYTIAQGIVVGDKNIIPYHIREYFINSGISHILSISGLHISMLLYIFFLLLSFFKINFYKKILISTIIAVIIYIPITLFSVSIIRSSIMAICLVISYYFDRDRNTINSLFLSAIIILILNPNSIKDISFQFSFLATLSIALYYPIFNFYILRNIKNIKVNNSLIKNIKSIIIRLLGFLSINIFALILVLPLSTYHFSVLNITSIISNIFAVPLSFIILSSSLITILTYNLYPPLSIYPANTTEFFSNLLINLSEKFSNISFLKYEITINLYLAILITVIIAFIGFIIRINMNDNQKKSI